MKKRSVRIITLCLVIALNINLLSGVIMAVDTDWKIPNVLEYATDHRPVPTEFEKTNDLYDNLFFEMPGNPDEMFNLLKENKKDAVLIATEDDIFGQKNSSGENIEHGHYMMEKKDENDIIPERFRGYYQYSEANDEKATQLGIHRTVKLVTTTVPSAESGISYRVLFGKKDGVSTESGDSLVIHFYARNIGNGGQWETGNNKIRVNYNNSDNSNSSIYEYTKRYINIGPDWTSCYITFYHISESFSDEILAICINPSFYEGIIEIGKIEIYNFGKDCSSNELPDATGPYKGYEDGAQWRSDAIERIEKIRKGDVKIAVKDENGNPISNADLAINMYEHEFLFSVAASASENNTILKYNQNYREKVVENFNSIGTEAGLKRSSAVEDESLKYISCDKIYEWAQKNGCANDINGHLISPGNEKTSLIKHFLFSDLGLTEDDDLTIEDKERVQIAMRNHIIYLANRYPYITSWDVAGEDAARSAFGGSAWYLGNIMGRDIICQWYDYVKAYIPNALRTFSDNFNKETFYFEKQKEYMDWLNENVDFDVIGVEGHCGYEFEPEGVLHILNDLSSYGKKMRVTEFDSYTGATDVNYQGNVVRDALILYFSIENIDYIQLWGLQEQSSGGGKNRVMYYNDYTLKPAGKVYQDLVYNKWWTRENLVTNESGECSLRAFYGDYDITVTKDGIAKTISVPIHKGNENNIDLVLDSKTHHLVAAIETVENEYEIISTCSGNQGVVLTVEEYQNKEMIGNASGDEPYVVNRLNFVSSSYQRQEDDSNLQAIINENGIERKIMLKGIRSHVIKGDIDDDGEITILDVRLLLQAYINAAGKTKWLEEELAVMDVNEDGTVDILDVRLLLQMYINQ